MAEAVLLRSDADHIATLTLNSPATYNALSGTTLVALKEALTSIATDASIRVVLLKGAGKAFCAGHDLKEIQAARAMPDQGAAAFASLFTRCGDVMQLLRDLPQPVIACIQGIATAAGCQLVASCDLAVAASDARFGVNGVNIGLFCSTPMVALTRKVPAAIAFEMLTTGAFITAERAREIGLINRVTTPETLDAEAQSLAETLAAKLTAAVRIGKGAFYRQAEMPLADAYAYAGAVMVENLMQRDTEEGITAFLEKRKPDWS